MNPEECAKRLIGIIAQLSGVLKEENTRLAVPGRTQGLPEIVKEKETLSRSYEQQIKTLSSPEYAGKLKPELRARITDALTSLTNLMDENRRKIELKLEATKTVFKIMAEAAKEYRAASGGYGKTGAMGTDTQPTRQAYRPAVSLGINREL